MDADKQTPLRVQLPRIQQPPFSEVPRHRFGIHNTSSICVYLSSSAVELHRSGLDRTVVSLLFLAAMSSHVFALDWRSAPGHRTAELSVPAAGKTGFAQMSQSQTG